MNTIMAVGAHTGDAQLTCGMLLSRQAAKGDRVITLDLTAGERGCPKGMRIDEFRQMNIEGAAQFAHLLGGESIVMDTPDGELESGRELAIRIADIMREHQVTMVLQHWKHSMHKDHMAAYKLTQDAVFFASLPTFERPLPPAPIRSWYYAENWEDSEGFVPYAYFDVSETFETWKEAVKKLYLTEHSRDFRYLQYYEGLARARGALIKTDYATAFATDDYAKRVRPEI